MLRSLLVIALAGCGRIGFDVPADAPDAPRAPWALIQTAAAQSSTLRLVPVGAGHLVVVAVQLASAGPVELVDDSGCNTYTEIAGAHSFNTNQGDDLRMFYAKDTCAGARAITITTVSSITAAAWEVSAIRTDEPLDSASALNDQPPTTTPSGPSITTSTAGEFVVSVAIVTNSVTSIAAGNEFTNDHTANGNAWAHLTDRMAPAGVYRAEWNQPVRGTYCASAAAFKVAP